MVPAQRALRGVIGRTRRRLRLQRFLDVTVTALVPAVLAATIAVYLIKAGFIGATTFAAAMGCALGIPLLAGLVASLTPVLPLGVAKRIDSSHALHDRVSTALEFCGLEERTDFMRAQIEESLHRLPGVSARRAAPFRAPRDLLAVGLLLLCLALVVILRFPGAPPPRPGAPSMERLSIAPEELEPHRALARQLQQEAREQDLEQVNKLARELNKLFDQIQRKELTRKELFAKLAELERKYLEGLDGNFDDLLKKLTKMGGELQKEKLTKDAGDALKKGDLARTKQELEKLAEQLKKLDDQQKRRLAKTLDKAAQQRLEQDKLQRKLAELNQQIRRLQRQLKNQPKDQQAQRRLQRKRRQLQRLNQQQQQHAQQQRQLQRLNQQMQQAAQDLLNKLSPAAMKALQQAAQQMGKFANQINKLKMMNKAQGQLADLKELLRRLGQGGKIRIGRLQDFNQRAGGKQGKGKGQGQGKGQGKGQQVLLLDPTGQGGKLMAPLPGQGQGQGQGQDDPRGAPGDGIGNSTDPNLMGDKTRLNARRRDVMVSGKQGKGPTRSEVILGASDQGFSTTSYRRVYQDYTQIIEEVLNHEDVPLGYKYYVKRYFMLIKPR